MQKPSQDTSSSGLREASRTGWFPAGFGAASSLVIGAWTCFILVVAATNLGLHLPGFATVFALLWFCEFVAFWISPLWLFAACIFVFSSGIRNGKRMEKIQLAIVVGLSVGYFAFAMLFG